MQRSKPAPAGLADPCVAYLPEAEYLYRRRADSVIGSMWSKPDRYTAVVEHGYLRLLSLHDPPPLWLQNLVLYDLLWMFHEYEQPDSPNRELSVEVNERFLVLLDQVLFVNRYRGAVRVLAPSGVAGESGRR